MELPPYRMPTVRGLLLHTWERLWQYVKKAGTVILAISVLLWALMTFPALPDERVATYESMREQASHSLQGEELENRMADIANLEAEAGLRYSLAGRVGTFFEPVSSWAGFDWRTNVALVGGFAAKEVIVSTLGTAYSLGEVDAEDAAPLSEKLASDPMWSPATALALLAFVLLYAPCFVTLVVQARESSWKWAAFSAIGNTIFAFAIATTVYHCTKMLL